MCPCRLPVPPAFVCLPALPADAPPITFVVVQKRHNTRLFPLPQDQQNRDRSGNILPGACVGSALVGGWGGAVHWWGAGVGVGTVLAYPTIERY